MNTNTINKIRLYTARALFSVLVFVAATFALISSLAAIKAALSFDFYTLVGAVFTVYALYRMLEKAHKKLEMEEDRFYSTFDFSF